MLFIQLLERNMKIPLQEHMLMRITILQWISLLWQIQVSFTFFTQTLLILTINMLDLEN